MKRYLLPYFTEYIDRKIILLTGPRQVGKTTFVKSLHHSLAYYNYDNKEDALVFLKQEWDRRKSIVIFDELHKKQKWKLWLKGIFDSVGVKNQGIIVTGSARLDTARKTGDSLAGRFFSYRMYPLDLKELKGQGRLEKNYETLLKCGGFPEPFFEGTEKFYHLWKKTHVDLILKQDLLSLEMVRDIDSLEMLIEVLAHRVGGTISHLSLARELDKDEKTIKRWLEYLENLYVIFKVQPFTKSAGRVIKKASKYYFYDLARVKGKDAESREAAQLENLVALALKKEIDFQSDCKGKDYALFFSKLRGSDVEVDFLITHNNQPIRLIEVKRSQHEISSSLRTVGRLLKGDLEKIQLVKNLKREYSSPDGVQVLSALPYLENLTV